jgi:hypothetical protein
MRLDGVARRSMTAIAASASAAVVTVMKRALSMTDISSRIVAVGPA